MCNDGTWLNVMFTCFLNGWQKKTVSYHFVSLCSHNVADFELPCCWSLSFIILPGISVRWGEAYWENGRARGGRWAFREECLSEPVVYTWQTLIIIIMIMICKGQGELSEMYVLRPSCALVGINLFQGVESLSETTGMMVFIAGYIQTNMLPCIRLT